MTAPDPSKDYRDVFGPTADEYRRVSRILRWPPLVGLAFWPLLLIPKTSAYAGYRLCGIIGFVLCIVCPLIASLVWLPRLRCPACQEKMEAQSGSLGTYCPECGQAALEESFLGQKCTACGKSLRNGRGGRSYKIRFCTRCGAHVDDEGV
jgi:predicted RNA-binding Zn-ribbon protein involved in translation (DUF1610 family)